MFFPKHVPQTARNSYQSPSGLCRRRARSAGSPGRQRSLQQVSFRRAPGGWHIPREGVRGDRPSHRSQQPGQTPVSLSISQLSDQRSDKIFQESHTWGNLARCESSPRAQRERGQMFLLLSSKTAARHNAVWLVEICDFPLPPPKKKHCRDKSQEQKRTPRAQEGGRKDARTPPAFASPA